MLKRLKKALLGLKIVKSVALFGRNGALHQLGWRSPSVALPWITFGAIDYLEHTIHPEKKVLELGGGSSTLWWAKRGNPVVTIETSKAWYDQLMAKAEISEFNVKLILVEEINLETLRKEIDGEYDVVIADHSGDRSGIVEIANEFLSANGLVVFDNSDREKYVHIKKLFSKHGFGYISFFGLVPGLRYATECTVFCRNFQSPDWSIQPRQTIRY